MTSLKAKNEFGFIDGTIKAPSEKDPKYKAWRTCNQVVKSWMLNSINPSLMNTIIFFDTATDVWADHDTIHLPNGSHIDTLLVGYVQVNPYLYVKNVLHIPSFQVNLL